MIAPAPRDVPTARVAPYAVATASRSRAKSTNRYPVSGTLDSPWPRKSNRTLVPARNGVNAASSFRELVRPCANTVTGGPSPSTSTWSVASWVVMSGMRLIGPSAVRQSLRCRTRSDTARTRSDRVAQIEVSRTEQDPSVTRFHVRRDRRRWQRHRARCDVDERRSGPPRVGISESRGVHPCVLRVPARTGAQGVDPAQVRHQPDRDLLPRVRREGSVVDGAPGPLLRADQVLDQIVLGGELVADAA